MTDATHRIKSGTWAHAQYGAQIGVLHSRVGGARWLTLTRADGEVFWLRPDEVEDI